MGQDERAANFEELLKSNVNDQRKIVLLMLELSKSWHCLNEWRLGKAELCNLSTKVKTKPLEKMTLFEMKTFFF